MDGDQKFWFGIIVVIGITVSSVAWAISWGYVSSWKAVTDKGYIEQPIPSSSGTTWVKPKE